MRSCKLLNWLSFIQHLWKNIANSIVNYLAILVRKYWYIFVLKISFDRLKTLYIYVAFLKFLYRQGDISLNLLRINFYSCFNIWENRYNVIVIKLELTKVIPSRKQNTWMKSVHLCFQCYGVKTQSYIAMFAFLLSLCL